MELRINWLRGVCAALAFGILVMPLTASAQDKVKVPAKKHKITQKKKTRSRRVKHTPKVVPAVVIVPPPAIHVDVPVQAVPTTPDVPVAGKAYDEATWRGTHPEWNGQYHYNNGKYYYDAETKFQAVISNDFNSIVGRFGGVEILENDPNLVFTGDSGEPYPIIQYNADRVKPDKKFKLKSAFFGRAYFWREGSRYDRKMVVDDKGVRCFQFVKHP